MYDGNGDSDGERKIPIMCFHSLIVLPGNRAKLLQPPSNGNKCTINFLSFSNNANVQHSPYQDVLSFNTITGHEAHPSLCLDHRKSVISTV